MVTKLRDDLRLRSNIAVHTPEHTGLQAPPADPATALSSEFEDNFIDRFIDRFLNLFYFLVLRFELKL